MRILVLRSSSMGDIIHALPMAYDIKKHRPDVTVVWAVEKMFEDIARLSPHVDELVVSNFRGWRKRPWASWGEFQAYRQRMKALKVERVLDIQGTMRSAYMAYLTNAPTWGYQKGQRRERWAGFAYDYEWDLPPSIAAVTRYRLAAARALGYGLTDLKPTFDLRPVAQPSWTTTKPFAALCVNTSRQDKYWAQDHWIGLGTWLTHQFGLQCALFYGNEREKAICTQIAQALPDAVVVPKASLAQTAAILAQAHVLVGVDTGLTHLGAALGVPSVGVFVSTPLERVALVGEGPVVSFGDNPGLEQIQAGVRSVLATTTQS